MATTQGVQGALHQSAQRERRGEEAQESPRHHLALLAPVCEPSTGFSLERVEGRN